MKTKTNSGSLWAVLAITSLAIAVPSCGDDEDDGGGGGKGGSSGKGGSAGASGASGKGGSAGQGGTTGGSVGQGGTAGKGGTAGQGGTTSGAGGQGGDEGGMGGEGGQGGVEPVTLFDFEDGVQGWGGNTAAQSSEQHVDGASSLKLTHDAIDNGDAFWSVATASRNGVEFWPGTVLTFHAFVPANWDTTGNSYFQAIGQVNNYSVFDSTGNEGNTPVPGGWTTWTYTIPETFPGGFQTLGLQIGDNTGGGTIPAGSIYVDAITAIPSDDPGCARDTPSETHDFETAWAALPEEQPYQVADGTDQVTGPNITIGRSTMRAFAGTASLGVAFTAFPPAGGGPMMDDTGKRIVFVNNPNIYCGQNMTFHVFLPTGSEGLTFQVFAQYDNYTGFAGTGPIATVTRDGWNTATFTVPTSVGPGGIQRVGIEFIYTGTVPYTGDVYIDEVSW